MTMPHDRSVTVSLVHHDHCMPVGHIVHEAWDVFDLSCRQRFADSVAIVIAAERADVGGSQSQRPARRERGRHLTPA